MVITIRRTCLNISLRLRPATVCILTAVCSGPVLMGGVVPRYWRLLALTLAYRRLHLYRLYATICVAYRLSLCEHNTYRELLPYEDYQLPTPSHMVEARTTVFSSISNRWESNRPKLKY